MNFENNFYVSIDHCIFCFNCHKIYFIYIKSARLLDEIRNYNRTGNSLSLTESKDFIKKKII